MAMTSSANLKALTHLAKQHHRAITARHCKSLAMDEAANFDANLQLQALIKRQTSSKESGNKLADNYDSGS